MITTPIIPFDYAVFCLEIPLYSNPTDYPESEIQNYWNTAIFYVSNQNFCGSVQSDKRQYAINLMTAHLIYLAGLAAEGQVPGLMVNASIDKVSVGLIAPPFKNLWQWNLSLSPYGQLLLALLSVNSVGGYYIGGAPVLSGFYGSPTNGILGGCC